MFFGPDPLFVSHFFPVLMSLLDQCFILGVDNVVSEVLLISEPDLLLLVVQVGGLVKSVEQLLIAQVLAVFLV